MVERGQRTVDNDREAWARAILSDRPRPGLADAAEAYRILARVDPETYQGDLARALARLSWDQQYRDAPDRRLTLLEEAATLARGVTDDSRRGQAVVDVLDRYQRVLYELGRRSEGFAMREEMAAVTRERVAAGDHDQVIGYLQVWAFGLAEERRHDEAAATLAEMLDVERRDDGWGATKWTRFSLIAQLDAAGRTDEAIATLAALIAEHRAKKPRTDATSPSLVFLMLVWHSVMLDRAGRRADADAARREALGLVRQLAATGETHTRSGIQLAEAEILIAAQAQDVEPDVRPRPPYGTGATDWSPDLRARYFEETGGPWCGTPATGAPGTLRHAISRETRPAELAALRRRLSIRMTVYWLWHHRHAFLEPSLPFVDDSVAAGRRFAADDAPGSRTALARALTDRATVLVAGHRYADALTDYAEALALANVVDG
jgi:tetratricopeptide (TPR) repeat protein